MNEERDEQLEQLKAANPDWGRMRLAEAIDCSPSYVQRWLNRRELAQDEVYAEEDKQLTQILSKLSPKEKAAILRNASEVPPEVKPWEMSTDVVRFGVMSDTHVGHKNFREDWLYRAYDFWAKCGAEFIYHSGDIVEGMSGRDGQIYELTKFGFEEQVDETAKLFDQCPAPIRAITGNHDGWFKIKGNIGACVGKTLENRCHNFTHLGQDEADELLGNIKVKLWHGGDGASYALSYRTQKFVEALTGGDKPHILLSGHAHKSIFFQFRNVEIIEAGTLQSQTRFMRGKKLAAHPTVYMVEAWQNDDGLERIRVECLRFYE
jgi:predicted phosphodiesterase